MCHFPRYRSLSSVLREQRYSRGEENARYILFLTSVTRPSNVLSDGNRQLITVIECISAAGQLLRPTILFKGKTFQNRWLTDRIKPARYGNTENGWTNDVEGLAWANDFVEKTKP